MSKMFTNNGKQVEGVTYAEAIEMTGAIRNYLHQMVKKGRIAEVGKDHKPGTLIERVYLSKEDVQKFAAKYNPRDEEEASFGNRYELMNVTGEQWEALKPTLDEMGIDYRDLTAYRRAYNQQNRLKQKADRAMPELHDHSDKA